MINQLFQIGQRPSPFPLQTAIRCALNFKTTNNKNKNKNKRFKPSWIDEK